MIDKHLGKVTAAFAVAVVAGFLAVAFLGGGAKETNEKCDVIAAAKTA